MFYHVLKIQGCSPRSFRLDKTCAVSVLNSFKNDPLLIVFAFTGISTLYVIHIYVGHRVARQPQ